LIGLVSSGCSTTQPREVAEDVDIGTYASFHVVRSLIVRQGANHNELAKLIQAELIRRGKKASFGKKSEAPEGAQVFVSPEVGRRRSRGVGLDVVELKIHFADAEEGTHIGTVSTRRASFVRRRPEELVRGLLDRCFPSPAH